MRVLIILLVLALTGCGGGVGDVSESDGQQAESYDVEFTLRSLNSSAYGVRASEDLRDRDQKMEGSVFDTQEQEFQDPKMFLRVGKRYQFYNRSASSHPLEFVSADGEVLLSQSDEGSYELDNAINWREKEDGRVYFTYTRTLSEILTRYRCVVHPGQMRGDIQSL